MDGLQPHELQSTILTLPAEIRLRIYAYTIPTPSLPIDLCNHRREVDDCAPTAQPPQRISIIHALFNRSVDLKDIITNQNGLQLLLVCRRIASEAWQILRTTTVRFCCVRHFSEVIRAFRDGIGEGRQWIRRVEIVLDLSTWLDVRGANGQASPQAVEGSRYKAREAMGVCQRTIRDWYGRLDLMGREKWTYEAYKEVENGDDRAEKQDGSQAAMHPAATAPQLQGSPPNQVMGAGRAREAPNKWLIKGWFDID